MPEHEPHSVAGNCYRGGQARSRFDLIAGQAGPIWQKAKRWHIVLFMAITNVFDTKISPEGRVVIPAEVRRALSAKPGDRVRFLLDESGVRLVSAQLLADNLWANNRGDGSDDSALDMRTFRDNDAESSRSSLGHAPHDEDDDRTDEQVAAELIAVITSAT